MNDKKQSKYIDRIVKSVGKAINRYHMINAGDRVAVPLSGGKDSMVLLDTLSVRKKHLPISYELIAVHVSVENIPYRMDAPFVQSFCDSIGVPLRFRHIRVDHEGSGLSPCFLCSRYRRKAIFLFAGEEKCNRVAFGHHMDDMIETLFLNMAFQGSMSSMQPRLSMFGGEFDIIRPLMLLSEQEIQRYANIRNLHAVKKECPFAEKNKRTELKKILKQIYRLNRKARSNIFRSLTKILAPGPNDDSPSSR